MYKSIAKKGAGLDGAVVESIRIEGDSIIVSARPRKRAPRCPVCGRRCDAYDRLPARRWRALDDGALKRYVEYAPTRVRCPEHGVRSEAVLWARSAASRFTRGFEDQVAWLACACSRSAVSELMRVDWHTVGGICARVAADLDARAGGSRLDGLRRIGIDETSYKKGRRYMTVVVDHDSGCVVWCAKGHGRAQLEAFADELGDERAAAVEVVTADGARWIAGVVAERMPAAELAIDPFHAVSWCTDALDVDVHWKVTQRGCGGELGPKEFKEAIAWHTARSREEAPSRHSSGSTIAMLTQLPSWGIPTGGRSGAGGGNTRGPAWCLSGSPSPTRHTPTR